jgi:hypothetical protein
MFQGSVICLVLGLLLFTISITESSTLRRLEESDAHRLVKRVRFFPIPVLRKTVTVVMIISIFLLIIGVILFFSHIF